MCQKSKSSYKELYTTDLYSQKKKLNLKNSLDRIMFNDICDLQ